jgi:hypothetical protein
MTAWTRQVSAWVLLPLHRRHQTRTSSWEAEACVRQEQEEMVVPGASLPALMRLLLELATRQQLSLQQAPEPLTDAMDLQEDE